ncbi:hypothetical protein JCM10908_005178 [Rhodotorula pacifica]|uniref:serine hydrolase domain-containing protein n=1 Tax=Rhodotorula pacifica TaxID=1495444 RepID=UPI003181EFCB
MLKSTTELDAIIANATKDPYHELTRFVFLAASREEESLYSGKGGYARLPTIPVDGDQLQREGEPITEASIFELYSCTKLPTTIATLQLVEQGKLGLDDEVRQHVPECGQVKVFEGFDEAGELKLAEPERPVTVRMLLTHTSGFSYAMIDPNLLKVAEKLGVPGDFYIKDAKKELFTVMPLKNQPGTAFAYGTSLDWMSLVVEKVSGLPLEEYFQQNIFGPLGITDTSFHPDPKQVYMAYANESDPSQPFKLAEHWPTSGMDHFGGAGLHGSARSWLRMLRALLRGGELDGKRILSEKSVELMFTDQLTNEGQRETCPDFAQIGYPVPARNVQSLKGLTFGFGGALNASELNTGRAPGTLVWRGMANTPWFIDRTNNVAVVVFSNVLPRNEPHFQQAWFDAETALYKALKA